MPEAGLVGRNTARRCFSAGIAAALAAAVSLAASSAPARSETAETKAPKPAVQSTQTDKQTRAKSSLWTRIKEKKALKAEATQAAQKPKIDFGKQPVVAANFKMNTVAAEKAPKSSLWSRLQKARSAEEAVTIAPASDKVRGSANALAAGKEEVVPESMTPEVWDPLEPVNRATFTLNEALDLAVFRPVSFGYRTVVPDFLRFGIANALHNFSSPVIFANDLLQGRPDKAGKTFMRFLINSTAGFGGLFDAAAAGGIESHTEDFGQTLAVWGAGQGMYIVVPILGPTTTRDGVGHIVDTFIDPSTWLMWNLALQERLSPTMAYTVSGHEALMDDIDAMRKSSPDFYASLRDAYVQKRASEIADGDGTLEPINSTQ